MYLIMYTNFYKKLIYVENTLMVDGRWCLHIDNFGSSKGIKNK